jgi:PBSX family phage terminase large subunit
MLAELSRKQKISLKESTARLNFWVGAVRSGKSFSALLRFIEFAMSDIEGDFAIIGRTEDSLKRNVISELTRLLGNNVRYYIGKREINIYNRKIHVIGANDDRAEAKIRGSTFSGALVDEVTMIPENFFKMLLSRLSIQGSKLFATTNPDSPFHWIKKDFFEREKELDLKSFHFILDDNPSLTEDYKQNIRKEYQGLWYKRFIEGEWVLAEGAIYDFFNDDLHTISYPEHQGKYYVVGIDYGTTNPCAFTMIGFNPDKYPNMWVEKEYYWSSKEKMRQKTDSEYCDDLKIFIHNYPIKAIVIDPSAASFIAECRKQGVQNLRDANNDVISGIRYVSQLLTVGTLKICKKCTNLIKEIQTYVWDEVSAKNGIEKPKKTSDHCLDALRYGCMYFYENNAREENSAEVLREKYNETRGIRNNLPKFFNTDYIY